jgi:uncharacterized Zn-binding protein involved in type VI secretion
MPGPPAPFVPTPLPNIGKSDNSPSGYSTSVTIEGQPVAIKGATFKSMGDVASQGTGGGIVSATTQGATQFAAPGSMDVKIEGQNVQLLGDTMLNNCSNPPNALSNEMQSPEPPAIPPADEVLQKMVCDCDKNTPRKKGQSCMQLGDEKHNCMERAIRDHNGANGKPRLGGEAGFTGETPPVMLPFDRKKTFASVRRGTDWPDAVSFDSKGDPEQIFDFKFKCPSSSYDGAPSWGRKRSGASQLDAYTNLTRRFGKDPKVYPPTKLDNTECAS